MRRVLALIFTAAAAYLLVLAALIGLRLVPGARETVRRSNGILNAFARVSGEIDRLDRSIIALDELVRLGAGAAASARPSARERIPRVGLLEAARLAFLPSPLRVGLAAASETESDLGNLIERAVTELELGDDENARATLLQVRETRDVLARQLYRSLQAGYADLARSQELFADAARLAWLAVAAWLALGVLLVPGLWLWLRRRIYAPLAELDNAAARVAAGELDVRVEPRFTDEMGHLAEHFNAMAAHLRAIDDDRRQRTGALESRIAELEARSAQLEESARRERELRESLEHLAEAQSITRIGSFQLDLRSNHMTCSPELCAIFGVEGKEFGATYQDFLRFIHPSDTDEVQARLHACMNEGAPFDLTHRIVRADGAHGSVLQRGRVTRDAAGRAVRLVATVQLLSGGD